MLISENRRLIVLSKRLWKKRQHGFRDFTLNLKGRKPNCSLSPELNFHLPSILPVFSSFPCFFFSFFSFFLLVKKVKVSEGYDSLVEILWFLCGSIVPGCQGTLNKPMCHPKCPGFELSPGNPLETLLNETIHQNRNSGLEQKEWPRTLTSIKRASDFSSNQSPTTHAQCFTIAWVRI